MKKKTTTISCQEVKHSIKRYLRNEMEIGEAEQFVKHIRSCKACRAELEEYYAFAAVLMQIEEEETVLKTEEPEENVKGKAKAKAKEKIQEGERKKEKAKEKIQEKIQAKTEEPTEKSNFFKQVEKRLEETEKEAKKIKSDHIKRRVIYVCIAITLAAAMGVSFSG